MFLRFRLRCVWKKWNKHFPNFFCYSIIQTSPKFTFIRQPEFVYWEKRDEIPTDKLITWTKPFLYQNSKFLMILTWLIILHCLALNVIGHLIILPKFSWMGAGLVPCPPLPSDTTGGQFDTPNAADTFVWKPVLLPGTAKDFEMVQNSNTV